MIQDYIKEGGWFSTPESRLALLERFGVAEYNRLWNEEAARNTVATVNGFRLRWVDSRFGRLVMVDGTDRAFHTLVEASAFALAQVRP